MLSPGITGTYRQRATHTLRQLRATIAAALCPLRRLSMMTTVLAAAGILWLLVALAAALLVGNAIALRDRIHADTTAASADDIRWDIAA